MRIVISGGGLGNTMFQYALVVAFREMFPTQKTALFVSNIDFIGHHNGYELEQVFPNVNRAEGLNLIQRFYLTLTELLRQLPLSYGKHFPFKVLFFPRKRCFRSDAMIYFPEVFNSEFEDAVYCGVFQSPKYFDSYRNTITKAFTFDITKLNKMTKNIWGKIQNTQSVSVHIRRGDYLSAYYFEGLGKVCDISYYERAITYIKKRVINPVFYFFSDDMEYVRTNLKTENAVYVDINTATESWQDMFLMSQCRHNILANSTFSWWGAYLNNNQHKIVVSPQKWWSTLENDDVIPDSWVRI